MKPLDAAFATLITLAIVAVLVSTQSPAAASLNAAFQWLTSLVQSIMTPPNVSASAGQAFQATPSMPFGSPISGGGPLQPGGGRPG